MTEKTSVELVEEMKGSLTKFQTKNDEVVAEIGVKAAANHEGLKKMQEDFTEATETLQKLNTAIEASDKHIKEMEVRVARGVSTGLKDGELQTSDGIKEVFHKTLRLLGSQYQAPQEVVKENFKEHVAHYLKHLPADAQDLMVKNLMAEGSDAAGGIWCPVPTDQRIRRRMFETTPMRPLATVLNVSTQALEFALDDEEAFATESGEIDTRVGNNTPEWAKVRINVHELYSYPKATLAFLEDNVINAEGWLTGKTSRKFARKQNTAFALGDGVKSARGVLDYADAAINVYERDKLGTRLTAASITLAGADLIDLQSYLLEDYQANATWMMHRLIWALVMKLTSTTGQYLLNPAMLFQGAKPQLLGAPVVMAGDYPNLTSGILVANQFLCTYGDMREGYTILDRLGINVIRDNITEPGFVKWNFRTRYGGGVTNFQAIKRLKALT